jgi:hypothetical protein
LIPLREFSMDSEEPLLTNKTPTTKSMELKRPNVTAKSATDQMKSKMLPTPSSLLTESLRPPTFSKERLKLLLPPLTTSWPPFPTTLVLLMMPEKEIPKPITEVPSSSTMPSTPSMIPLISSPNSRTVDQASSKLPKSPPNSCNTQLLWEWPSSILPLWPLLPN